MHTQLQVLAPATAAPEPEVRTSTSKKEQIVKVMTLSLYMGPPSTQLVATPARGKTRISLVAAYIEQQHRLQLQHIDLEVLPWSQLTKTCVHPASPASIYTLSVTLCLQPVQSRWEMSNTRRVYSYTLTTKQYVFALARVDSLFCPLVLRGKIAASATVGRVSCASVAPSSHHHHPGHIR